MKISVIIPVYNELKTVEPLLAKVEAVPIEKEIIVVDDCSTDGTRELLVEISKRQGHVLVLQPVNQGKGSRVASGNQQSQK